MVKGTVVWDIMTMNKAFCKSTSGDAGRTTKDKMEIPHREYMPTPVKVSICVSSHRLPVKEGVKHKQSACWPLVFPRNNLVLGL